MHRTDVLDGDAMLEVVELVPVDAHLQHNNVRRDETLAAGRQTGRFTSGADLVAVGGGRDHHFKHAASSERHAMNFLLRLPEAAPARVEHHLVPAVEARVEVEGDVAGLVGPTKQVHEEPAGGRAGLRRATSSVQARSRLLHSPGGVVRNAPVDVDGHALPQASTNGPQVGDALRGTREGGGLDILFLRTFPALHL